MKIEDINPANYNPRKITANEKKGLQNSMQLFGDIAGIVFNRTTGNLIAGHQRFAILKEYYTGLNLRETKIRDRYQVFSGEVDTGYSIRVVDWDLETEKKANIAANNHAISGKFDNELLHTLLDDLRLDNDFKNLNFDILEADLQLGFFDDTGSIFGDEIDQEKATLKDLSEFESITFVFAKEQAQEVKEMLSGFGANEKGELLYRLLKDR